MKYWCFYGIRRIIMICGGQVSDCTFANAKMEELILNDEPNIFDIDAVVLSVDESDHNVKPFCSVFDAVVEEDVSTVTLEGGLIDLGNKMIKTKRIRR